MPTMYLYSHADVKFSNGFKEVWHKNPRFVAFISSLLPDRIKGIFQSFDDAYKQIPTDGPGIIYIEINTGLFKDKQQLNRDMKFLEKGMKGKLNLVDRVNAVILTASSYSQKNEKTFYTVQTINFKNSSPKYPLKNEFLDNICKVKIR